MTDEKPVPGSDMAIAQGCTCPVLDNNHGAFPPFEIEGEGAWYMVEGCPVHAPEAAEP